MEEVIEERIMRYWTARAQSFSQVRKNELHDELGNRWYMALKRLLPIGRNLKILDVGTGTGYFSILLAKHGYDMTGVDLTPAMIAEARTQAEEEGLNISFEVMNAQKLAYKDESFDAVISRNLTWTLPEPEKAYAEWFRVLKKDGVLINFDANYGAAIRTGATKRTETGDKIPYGHVGVTEQMTQENNEITLCLEISREDRPEWDKAVLEQIGFSSCEYDEYAGMVILRERSDPAAPIFLIMAKK